jgi:type IV pilus assembly protein PilO
MAIKLTKEQQQYLVAGVIMTGAFSFIYIKFFWLPISKHIAETEAKIADTQAKIDKATQQAARLPRIQAELAQLNQQALEAEESLPKTNSVPEILVRVTALAQKYGVEVMTFTPGAKSSREYFIELQYPLAIKGSYHNLGRFLAAIALEERIYNVVNVNYGGATADSPVQSISMTLISYQYKG